MRDARAIPALLLAYLAFVVYGSLVPLEFRPLPIEEALAAFRQIPFLTLGIESRADWVANGVLYLPLGCLTGLQLMRIGPRGMVLPMLALAVLLCTCIAVAVEFTQLFFPPRTVSQNDLLAEVIGSVLGGGLAPMLAPWGHKLREYLQHGGLALLRHALQAYAVSYLALCLFPYDLLLNGPEWRDKLASGLCGWWVAPDGPHPGLGVVLLLVEAVLAAPFGCLFALRYRGRPSRVAALSLGLLLGLAIELAQLAIASGVSQGASVLSRGLGVLLGAWLWGERARLADGGAQRLMRRAWLPASLAYLLALLLVNGWFAHPWQGLELARSRWAELRWLPFYYHYYTTEAVALYSLGSVALMYLPIALLGWACAWRLAPQLLMAGLLATGIEASKLFLGGQSHPDPTNVLIAMASIAVGHALLALAARGGAPRAVPPARVPAEGPDMAAPRRGLPLLAAVAALLLALGWAAGFPVLAPLLVLLLIGAALVVAWRPALALALLPAALPVLDLAPWTGRFYVDEFDLLLLVCLGVAGWRSPPAPALPWSGRRWLFGLLGLSLVWSAGRALLPWQWPDATAFYGYDTPFNALRILKGALEAWAFVWLLRRLLAAVGVEPGLRVLGSGVLAGLALTLAGLAWERLAFSGLLDFASEFRVSGPISAMHKGGAYIECYLAVAAAFAGWAALRAERWPQRVLAGGLLIATAYGVGVTFSRNGYAAFALVIVVLLAGSLRSASGLQRRVALALLGLLAMVSLPIVGGAFATDRLARSGADLEVRRLHWSDALAMRDVDLGTTLFGMGLGRFPATHRWRSSEAVHAGSYALGREPDGQSFLRLGGGAPLYIGQMLAPGLPPGALKLLARVRSSTAQAQVEVALCAKWLLTSADCRSVWIGGQGAADQWQTVEVELPAAGPTTHAVPRPWQFALITPAEGQRVDVADLRLLDPAGRPLLANADFAEGLDRWFFSTDVDPPWHIHSLPVGVLFDQGWLGVLAWAAVIVTALAHAARSAWRGNGPALVALAASLAFLASGMLNTLIDAPRFLTLLLLLLWFAAGHLDIMRSRSRSA